jgi:hypothetical protein
MNVSDTSSIVGKNAHASWILYDIFVFTAFYLIFFCIFRFVLWTDFATHMQIINDQLKNGDHFAFYMALPRYCYLLLSKITSCFNGQLGDETGCVVIMLSLAVFLKYFFTRRMIKYFIESCSELNCRMYAFSLAFVAPVALGMDTQNVHRWTGTLATSCWHNITIIFCVAFSLALFWYTVRWFKDGYKNRDFLLLCLYLALSILAKPSYMFAFMPAYCLLTLLYLPPERSGRILACIPVVLALGAYFIMSKQLEVFQVMAYGKEVTVYGRGIYWAPFEYFLYHLKSSRTILSVHSSSVMFPIFTGLYLGMAYLKKRRPVSVVVAATLLQFAFGVAAAYLFNMGEGGDRFHGNMTWQIMVCNYILFTMCVIAILREGASRWRTMLFAVYGMHVLSGLVFLAEIFRSKAGWVDPVVGWWG